MKKSLMILLLTSTLTACGGVPFERDSLSCLPGSNDNCEVVMVVQEVLDAERSAQSLRSSAEVCPSLAPELQRLAGARVVRAYWVSPSILGLWGVKEMQSGDRYAVATTDQLPRIRRGTVVRILHRDGCDAVNRVVSVDGQVP